MNKLNEKGLTLVELMAVISILAVLAVIITPNIVGSIKKARSGTCSVQEDTIISAAKNWAADEINTKHCLICIADETGVKTQEQCDANGGEGCVDLAACIANGSTVCNNKKSKTIKVTIGTLENGYLEEELKNPKTDEPYSTDEYVTISLDSSSYQYNYEFSVSCN
jgi:prepilin-type N-terminal cleavage/methylation domain-containing protein